MGRHSARVEQNLPPTDARDGALVLLAEDDPASGRFLSTCLESLGCRVVLKADGQAALAAARKRRFDLLLVDRNLPQLQGLALLRQLRGQIDAASHASPAVATSAEWNAQQRQDALDAGYAGILAKPCTLAELRQMLESHVHYRALPVCHDGAALDAAGSAGNLAALRRLFGQELGALEDELGSLCENRPQLLERMHRLCASAGFCGAQSLASACRHWLARLRENPHSDDGRREFEQALHESRKAFS